MSNGCRAAMEARGIPVSKIRTVLIGTAVLATLVTTSSAGFAQGTPEQRSACMGDAFKFCAAEIPNVPKITACMRANASKLSPACKAAVAKG
jgi:hypothetical protein